ncbi:hypothetical protein GCM10028832_01710 [Streptomyces sparsus]
MHRVRAGGDRSVWAVQDFDRVVERASLPDDFHLREHAREHRHHAARPHGPEDVADTFAYIRAMQADDIDMACAVADDTGPELHRLLLDVAARVIIPVTAVDDCDGEPCAHSFLAAALGRLLLKLLCHGECLVNAPGGAVTLIRFTDNILTADVDDVADVLRQLEAAGMKQAVEQQAVLDELGV